MSAILLLGGRSAIGLAVVQALLDEHGPHDVQLAQRLRPDEELPSLPGATSVTEVAFDALDLSSHQAVVDEVFAAHDVAFAVVAFGVLGDQEQAWTDVAAAQRLVQVNATAAIGVGVALARQMRRAGHGTIVAISSVAATRVRRANFVYGASKQAADSFYLELGGALRGSGVQVLVVRPGAIRSPMIDGRDPVALTRNPADVARAVVDGLRRRREVVHVPAVFGPVMVLARLVPGSLWRRLNACR